MKRLVLVGGGHSHAAVLKFLGERPIAGVETVLVNPGRYAAYSGMIPGLIAGDYAWRECHIDLARLAGFARARLIETRATGLEPGARRVLLESGATLDYDLLSLDVGSTPDVGVAGVSRHALSVKPIERFLQALDALGGRVASGAVARIAVVGAGAAGVEVLLTLRERLRRDTGSAPAFSLVSDAPQVLPGHHRRARSIVERILRERDVQVLPGRAVTIVTEDGLAFAEGPACVADAVIWATGASAAPWLSATGLTGLALDARGFIAVDRALRSVSHAEVFASGDCATIADAPQPKSGVSAVRQGPVLAANLVRSLAGAPPLTFVPRPGALSLLNCGGRHAVASWGSAAFEGRWVWRWKDWIDRRFVARYVNLPSSGAGA